MAICGQAGTSIISETTTPAGPKQIFYQRPISAQSFSLTLLSALRSLLETSLSREGKPVPEVFFLCGFSWTEVFYLIVVPVETWKRGSTTL